MFSFLSRGLWSRLMSSLAGVTAKACGTREGRELADIILGFQKLLLAARGLTPLASTHCSPPAQVQLSSTLLATHGHVQAPQGQGRPPSPLPRSRGGRGRGCCSQAKAGVRQGCQQARPELQTCSPPCNGTTTPTAPGRPVPQRRGGHTASRANSMTLPLAEHPPSRQLSDSHAQKAAV